MVLQSERSGVERAAALPSVVILAGGRGTRIAHLFPDLPKPLVPAAGKPFLYWVVAWLRRHGLRNLILSTGYQAGMVQAWAGELRAQMGDLRLDCRSESEPLGTGGGLLNCLDLCGDHIIVVNGDSLADCNLSAGFADYIARDLDGMLFGVYMKDAGRFGTVSVDADRRLTAFHEKRAGSGLINAGVYIFRASALRRFAAGQACSIETDIIPRLLNDHLKIGVFESSEAAFIDIGTPETIVQASAFIESHPMLFSVGDDLAS